MEGKRRRLDGPGVESLPGHLLVEAASFLRRESRALWAVSMGAPSSRWSAPRAPTAAGRQILTLLREDWRDEWAAFDFGDFLCDSNDGRRLSDDDLGAVLVCIDGARSVRSLRLTGCSLLAGREIGPLRESTVLKRVDISLVKTRDHRPDACGLELDQVLPVLDSIIAKKENKLRHIQLPKKWLSEKDASLDGFIGRYNRALDLMTKECCQCEEEAQPILHEDGDRYGVQSATCYKCLREFCFGEESFCQDDWETSVEYCPCCEKYFCHQCCPVFWCSKCDDTISCEDCWECTWCSVDDCSDPGPFCTKCAPTET